MVQSPSWETNWSAASQETPRISRNPKVHYRIHKRPPPVSLLGQPNPVHTHTPHLLEIRSNIIRPSTPRFMLICNKIGIKRNLKCIAWSGNSNVPRLKGTSIITDTCRKNLKIRHIRAGPYFWSIKEMEVL